MKKLVNLVLVVIAGFVFVGCNNVTLPKKERIPNTYYVPNEGENDCILYLSNGIDIHTPLWGLELELKTWEDSIISDKIQSICANIEWEMKRVIKALNETYTGCVIVPNSDYNEVSTFSYKYDIFNKHTYYTEWIFEVVNAQGLHYILTFRPTDYIEKYHYTYKYEVTNAILLQE